MIFNGFSFKISTGNCIIHNRVSPPSDVIMQKAVKVYFRDGGLVTVYQKATAELKIFYSYRNNFHNI